jgi:putative hydrolases of HD superfamily
MKRIADLLFEARMLKEIPRSGLHFLGAGRESVAEHVYSTTFIAYVMSRLNPEVDGLKLISMCIVHDLAEARTGDLNSVQKAYVRPDESRAISDAVRGVPFESEIKELIREYREKRTPEAHLAHDADQIALLLELRDLEGIGYATPKDWQPHVRARLQTETGKAMAEAVSAARREDWWWDAAASREANPEDRP